MYLAHFKLSEKPFLLNTDPRFLWLGPGHQEALATLSYGARENKGLLLLTGDIGTGKTTLISALIDRLEDDTVSVARMPDPGRNRNEFYFLVAHSFGIQMRVNNKESFTKVIGGLLEDIRKQGKKALLIIDEAQMMSNELLEEVRLLSNLEYHNTKLLNIFLLGQNELNQLLLKPQNRAVRERIAITYNLPPLSEVETRAYIAHRLRVAGAKTSIFNTDAVRKIHALSKGSVRLINIICDLALVYGFEEDATRIDGVTIESCKEHLCLPPAWAPPPDRYLPAPSKTLTLIKSASAREAAPPQDKKAPPQPAAPASHATHTKRNILFALLVFLAVSYLLFAGLKHGLLKAKPAVNQKVFLPVAPRPGKTTGLMDPLQPPPLDVVETPSIGKKSMASPGRRTPPPVKTPTTVRSGSEHRQTGEKAIDAPQADREKPAPAEVPTRQAAKSRQLSSEPPGPAAIIDWLLRERHKNRGEQSR